MKKICILIFSGLMVILGCKKDTPEEVLIRIGNASPYRFENVRVNTSDQSTGYGAVKQNQNSAYMKFDMAYRYAYITLTIGDREFKYQPYDYVGETPLEPGKYTYSLSVPDLNSGSLALRLVED
jgi:hypothetical protein